MQRAHFRGVLSREVRFAAPGMDVTEAVQLGKGLPHEDALSELMAKRRAEGRGIQASGTRVGLLAFADDVCLFGSSLAGVRAAISELGGVLRMAGQVLQLKTCAWMPVDCRDEAHGRNRGIAMTRGLDHVGKARLLAECPV